MLNTSTLNLCYGIEYRHTLKPFARKYIILVLATAAFRTVLLGCSYQITDGSNLVALLFLWAFYLFIFIYISFIFGKFPFCPFVFFFCSLHKYSDFFEWQQVLGKKIKVNFLCELRTQRPALSVLFR